MYMLYISDSKAAATPSSFGEKRKHRRMLLTSDPAAYWAIFRPGTWAAEAEARSPELARLQVDSSTWVGHNAESPASCHAGRKAGDDEQSPAQEGAERVDSAEALVAAHKRIADLEREVLELRLSHTQDAVALKEPEAN